MDWLLPLGLYVGSCVNLWFSMRAADRERRHAADKRCVAALLTEAVALAKYGASDEAAELVSRAAEIDVRSD